MLSRENSKLKRSVTDTIKTLKNWNIDNGYTNEGYQKDPFFENLPVADLIKWKFGHLPGNAKWFDERSEKVKIQWQIDLDKRRVTTKVKKYSVEEKTDYEDDLTRYIEALATSSGNMMGEATFLFQQLRLVFYTVNNTGFKRPSCFCGGPIYLFQGSPKEQFYSSLQVFGFKAIDKNNLYLALEGNRSLDMTVTSCFHYDSTNYIIIANIEMSGFRYELETASNQLYLGKSPLFNPKAKWIVSGKCYDFDPNAAAEWARVDLKGKKEDILIDCILNNRLAEIRLIMNTLKTEEIPESIRIQLDQLLNE